MLLEVQPERMPGCPPQAWLWAWHLGWSGCPAWHWVSSAAPLSCQHAPACALGDGEASHGRGVSWGHLQGLGERYWPVEPVLAQGTDWASGGVEPPSPAACHLSFLMGPHAQSCHTWLVS